MAAVGGPPISNGLVSTYTLEMEEEVLDTSRHTPNGVTSAHLRRYHQQCNTQLDTTLQRFRERQERDRRARPRSFHSPLRLSSHGAPDRVPTDPHRWKLLRESSSICVYRDRIQQDRTSTVQALGTIHGSLTDVMNGLYADSTATARVLQLLLSPRSLDARVLQVDKRGTDTNPFQFSGIVWMALKVPGLGFCRHRDFVCFKKMDVRKDEMGQEFGYMVLHSIDPLMDDKAVATIDSNAPIGVTWRDIPRPDATSGSNNYVRGFISLAIVFQRAGDDRVAMFAYGQFNPSGRLSSLVGDNCIAEWLTSMANTVQSGQAKNLSRLLVSHKHETNGSADHLTSRPRCGVCARTLFFWDAPRHCRGCWKVCCRACRTTKPIFCVHSHTIGRNAAASFPSGPCTETFCLACVCSVIPSGATINARLLQRLDKKRKRTPTIFRQTITTSSLSDGSNAQRDIACLSAAEVSSISALSSRESERYQQHRLSLNAQPKNRAFVQWDLIGQEEGREQDTTSRTVLEMLEHYQMQCHDTVSEVSSSNVGTSLRTFTSADLTSTAKTPFQLARYPSGHSLVTHGQSFYHRVGLTKPSRQNQVHFQPDRPDSFNFQAQGSFWLPRQSTLVKKPIEIKSQLGDDYYQRLLHNYLLHTNSNRSLASSYGTIAKVSQPPVSQESHLVSELSTNARAATDYACCQEMSPLSPDVKIYRRFK